MRRLQGRGRQGGGRRSPVPGRFIRRIEEVLHPREIWLFGSRARSTEKPGSDWDLLVVLPDDAPPEHLNLEEVWRRLRDLRLERVDVFTVLQRDFDEARSALGTLSQIAATEGRRVYEQHPGT